MKRIRRTRTTVETRDVVTLRGPAAAMELHCPACGRVVRMLPPEEAAALAGVSVRALFRRMEAGGLHYAESPAGRVFVCSQSISQI